jgi:hypothetical protein
VWRGEHLQPELASASEARSKVLQTEVEEMESEILQDEQLREVAKARLIKRREFVAHLLAYVLVNAFLLAIWVITGAGFFWPVFLILGWGIGLFFHGWDTFSAPLSEARIDREVSRLRRSSAER